MTTVLVTGGAGYIGSHTCKLFAGAGHLPVVFDDLSSGHADAVRVVPLVVVCGWIRCWGCRPANTRGHNLEPIGPFSGSD